MIRRLASLPVRALKRALNALDGERSAPSPAPPMAPISRSAEAASAAPSAPAPSAPAPAAEAKAATKKAAPKKAAPKKAAPKKAAPKKAAAKKAAPKKATAKKAKSTVQVDPMDTPNPNAMKFTLSVTVAETGSFSFNSGETDIAHPIAAAVVALEDVESVFGVNDFITVSKKAAADWNTLLPKVVEAIKGAA